MGVDVNLYAATDCTPDRLAEAEETFFRRCPIADRYEEHWKSLTLDDDVDPGPRVAANVTCRYWGPGYERGDWPSIYGAIRLMQSLFPEATVYYGGDSVDDGVECSDAYLAEMWDHYLGPHGDDYRQRWP